MPSEIRQELIDSSARPDDYYLQPLSLLWRINHVIPYLIGGTTFFIGSIYYLPNIANYEIGAILFNIGSAGFLYADINEWWKNNRVGCMFDKHYRASYESQVACNMESQETMLGKYQRMENGLNYAFSAFGSFLYVVGSIFEIPELNTSIEGTIIYLVGSLVIFISQSWKIYRAGCTDAIDPNEKSFQFNNIFTQRISFFVDVNAGLGGFCYFVGSIFFLPSIADSLQGAIWFIFGGFFFSLSGLFLAYRYFGTDEYPH